MTAQNEWSTIQTAYAVPSEGPSRADVLTQDEDDSKSSITDDTASFISDIAKDLVVVSRQSTSIGQFLQGMFVVLTFENRGIIIGTVFVLLSLALLALMPPVANGSN